MATSSSKGFSKSSSGWAYGYISASSRLIRRARRTMATRDSGLPRGPSWRARRRSRPGAVFFAAAAAFFGGCGLLRGLRRLPGGLSCGFFAAGAVFRAGAFAAAAFFVAASLVVAAFLATASSSLRRASWRPRPRRPARPPPASRGFRSRRPSSLPSSCVPSSPRRDPLAEIFAVASLTITSCAAARDAPAFPPSPSGRPHPGGRFVTFIRIRATSGSLFAHSGIAPCAHPPSPLGLCSHRRIWTPGQPKARH